MRTFKYIEPKDPLNEDWSAVEVRMTEEQVLDYYWDYWSNAMLKKGLTPTKEQCIEDWTVVHWAREVYE